MRSAILPWRAGRLLATYTLEFGAAISSTTRCFAPSCPIQGPGPGLKPRPIGPRGYVEIGARITPLLSAGDLVKRKYPSPQAGIRNKRPPWGRVCCHPKFRAPVRAECLLFFPGSAGKCQGETGRTEP